MRSAPPLGKLGPLLALALVSPALTSCGLLGLGDDPMGDALDLVPDDATTVTFRDRAAIAERLGVDDVAHGATTEDVQRYEDALAADPTGTDELTQFAAAMQDSPVSELSVVWSISAETPEGGFTAYKVEDDTDLDAVADDLAASGFAEDELEGRRHLLVSSEAGDTTGAYPSSWLEVTVDPDEHLLIAGTADRVLGAIDDQVSSLADDKTYADVLGGTSGVEFAVVASPPTCGVISAEQAAASGIDTLGTPDRSAYVVADDGAPGARLEYADDDTAESDLEARRTYLTDGLLALTGDDVSTLGTFEVERDGSVVVVDVEAGDPRLLLSVAVAQDGPLACVAPTPDQPAEPAPAPSASPSASPSAGPSAPTTETATAPSEDSTVDLP